MEIFGSLEYLLQMRVVPIKLIVLRYKQFLKRIGITKGVVAVPPRFKFSSSLHRVRARAPTFVIFSQKATFKT